MASVFRECMHTTQFRHRYWWEWNWLKTTRRIGMLGRAVRNQLSTELVQDVRFDVTAKPLRNLHYFGLI